MNSYNLNKEIDEYLTAVTSSFALMDFNTFDETLVWFLYDPLIATSWTMRVEHLIDDCTRAKLAPQEIGMLFPSISQLRNMMLFDVWMAKYAGVSREARENIFRFYSEILHAICLDDPHAAHRRNVIHSQETIDALVSGTQAATPEIARLLGKLISVCYHFGHAAFSDMNPCCVYENYGPYARPLQGEGKSIVVVKEFNNLRPVELWPETLSLPCGRIQIICLYQQVDFSINNISHVMYTGDIINGLRQYRLVVDGKDAGIEDVQKLTAAIGAMAIQIFQKFQSLDFEKRKEMYFHQKAYVYKRIYDRLGQDWRPSEEILSEARGKQLCPVVLPKEKKEELAWFRRMADPRIDMNDV